MKINLKKYMNERDRLKALRKPDGPVVTVSREYGCGSNKVVLKLLSKISKYNEGKVDKVSWKYINKEIIEESAKELHLIPQRLEERVITHGTSMIDDIFSGFSHHYNLSNKKILETVKDIIETYSRTGNVIVVGRGGAALTHRMRNSLHVRFMAPIDWRINQISELKEITKRDAMALIEKVDNERRLWTENLSQKPFSNSIFDVVLNRAKLADDEIVDIIFNLMAERKFI